MVVILEFVDQMENGQDQHLPVKVRFCRYIDLVSAPGSRKLGVGGAGKSLINIACTCSVAPTHPQFSWFPEINVHERFSLYILGYLCSR